MILADDWTVVTVDGTSAHLSMVAITEHGPEVLTIVVGPNLRYHGCDRYGK